MLSPGSKRNLLLHASNYILQIIVAAGFTLHKLLNSFFASRVDAKEGIGIFHQTIRAIRTISIIDNDLPARLAEVLAQLWRAGGAGAKGSESRDDNLMLKVRCRMSMSLVFDSVWRWREEFQAEGRGNLDSMSLYSNVRTSRREILGGGSRLTKRWGNISGRQKPHESRIICDYRYHPL